MSLPGRVFRALTVPCPSRGSTLPWLPLRAVGGAEICVAALEAHPAEGWDWATFHVEKIWKTSLVGWILQVSL